ncbi:MAG TPA: tetratricopeptide repeat protein [Nitrospira sp.]
MHRRLTVRFLFPTILLVLAGCAFFESPDENAGTPVRQVDHTATVKEIQKAAEHGNADARNRLGMLYSDGVGVPQNYVQAKQWFEKAAEQGHAGAQVNLGTLYLLERGAPQSDQMALSYFRRAADQGDALAFAKLGLMYAQGRGVPQDYIQAHMWYNLAAANGEKRAAETRDALANHMTPAQVAEAQRLAREWTAKKNSEAKVSQTERSARP